MMSFLCFKTDQTEQPQVATGNSVNPAQYNFTNSNTSAEELPQAQASHMSKDTLLNSGKKMDVVSSFVFQIYNLQLNIVKV